ncbi:MAG: biotin carboxylase N-terminal domain-containing protein [Desulfohalobiaceae bacterium]
MWKTILIADRGEIAIRIIRSARELGIRTIAVYEEADRNSRHINTADEAICIGPGPERDYRNWNRIIQAALSTGAEAIHPGYGPLSENPSFIQLCENAELTFIGPSPAASYNATDRLICRQLMQYAGVPVIPGTDALPPDRRGERDALRFIETHGYPVFLKKAAEGDSDPLVAHSSRDLMNRLDRLRQSTSTSGKGPRIYLEQGIPDCRHIEVQLLADRRGNVVHLGTRDCSLRLGGQRMLAAGPAKLPSHLEERLCRDAVAAAQAVGNVNTASAGFLVDKEQNHYFLGLTTRIQEGHTVTEALTGLDLVREQIRLAAGYSLPFAQQTIQPRGHALELPIRAQDPADNFRSRQGTVGIYQSPGGHGIRLDGAIYQGYERPPFYDPLLVKLTVYGYSWTEAVDRLRRSLDGFLLQGLPSTFPFYRELVTDPEFREKRFHTNFLEERPHLLQHREEATDLNRFARLLAEINAYGYNPYASLD